jgi:uncharacterized membrane protein
VRRVTLLNVLKPAELVRAIAYGIGAGALGTLVLGYIPFLGLFGYAALGFGVGEAVAIGANRKRIRQLGPLAIACLLLGYWVGTLLSILIRFQGRVPIGPDLLLAPILALTGGPLIIGLVIGALLAWMRVR